VTTTRTQALLAALYVLCSAASCDTGHAADQQPERTELRYLASFGNIAYWELAEDLGYLAPVELKWEGNVLGGPESIQAVSTGDIDFGSAATGSVIKLIARGAPIQQVIASHGVDELSWGGYFVLDRSPLHSARDLIGKKISVNTLGAHAEFMIREDLRRGGLSRQEINEVTMVVTPPVNGEQTLRLGQVDVAALSGLLRDLAIGRGGIHPLFTDRGLFGNFNSGTVVFRKAFLAEHPGLVHRFVSGTARAIEWARTTSQAEVRERLREIFRKRGRGEDPSLAEHWHSVGVASRGGLLGDGDMDLWTHWLEREGDLKAGAVRKPASLYTNEFNPYREP
jgi:ABC-type nitrate/sulfonate/bicarbonate transport system substrate-binding protein